MNHLRICMWLRCTLTALACALPLAAVSRAAEPAHVTEVRHRTYAQFERIVLELDRAAPVERRAAGAGKLDLLLRARPAMERQVIGGAIRIERTEQGDTRVSAATGSLQVRVFTLPSPPRLVIDLGEPGLTAFVAPHDGTPIFAGASALPAEPPPTTTAEPAAPPAPAAEPETAPGAVPEAEPLATPSHAAPPLPEPELEPVPEVGPVAKVAPERVIQAPDRETSLAEAPTAVGVPATRPPRPFPAPLRPEAEQGPSAGADVVRQPARGPEAAPTEAPSRPPAVVLTPPVALRPAPGPPGGGSSGWWIAAALGLGVLAGAGLLLRRRGRSGASFDASTALQPASPDIAPEDLVPRGDRIELLEMRLDEEARERLHLESRLAEMSEEQKVLRDRLRRMTRQQREAC